MGCVLELDASFDVLLGRQIWSPVGKYQVLSPYIKSV
jgi:hypothetical protein